jgi:hypothetical protein
MHVTLTKLCDFITGFVLYQLDANLCIASIKVPAVSFAHLVYVSQMICCFLSHIFSYPSQEKSIFV